MNCLTIKELKSNDEILEAFPVMKQLRNQLNDSTYLQLVKEAQEKDCFHLVRITKWRRHCGADWIQTKDQPFHPADLFVTW